MALDIYFIDDGNHALLAMVGRRAVDVDRVGRKRLVDRKHPRVFACSAAGREVAREEALIARVARAVKVALHDRVVAAFKEELDRVARRSLDGVRAEGESAAADLDLDDSRRRGRRESES